MNRLRILVPIILIMPCIYGSMGAAEDSKGRIVIIAHVDVIPPHTAAATELLKKYRKTSLQEPGAMKMEILQQVGRPNHFTVVEEWTDKDAVDKHVGAASSKDFRSDVQPMLGAPYDERPHSEIQ